MPTSGRGSSAAARRGFTLIELMVVMAVIAIGVAVVTFSLRDPAATRLEREAQRLSALLETARAESRTTGVPAAWIPAAPGTAATGFRFVGLRSGSGLPERWLDDEVHAQIAGGAAGLVLGPDAILPPQRVILVLEQQRAVVSSDGVGAFVAEAAEESR